MHSSTTDYWGESPRESSRPNVPNPPEQQTSFVPIQNHLSSSSAAGCTSFRALGPQSMMGIQKRGVVRKRVNEENTATGVTRKVSRLTSLEVPSVSLAPSAGWAVAHSSSGLQHSQATFDSVLGPFPSVSSAQKRARDSMPTNSVSSTNIGASRTVSRSGSVSRKRPDTSTLDMELVSKLKRSRISLTPGQIRLEAGVKECRERLTSGYVDVYLERHTPGLVNIVVKRVFPHARPVFPLRFVAKAPKFYPHAPPTMSLLGDLPDFNMSPLLAIDPRTRAVMFPMLQTDTWSCVLSLYDIAINLACLVYDPAMEENPDDASLEMDIDTLEESPGENIKVNERRFKRLITMLPSINSTSLHPRSDSRSGSMDDDTL